MGAPDGEAAEATPVAADLPIVAIGASAGGIEALLALLPEIPPGLGAAFVVVQHRGPEGDSRLAEVLGRHSALEVLEIDRSIPVRPDRIHVLAPDHAVVVDGDHFVVTASGEPPGRRRPIDRLMISLARTQGPRAIGVVLSGTGNDGTEGLGALRAAGGYAMAQDPGDALQGGMPRAAIEAGAVDFHGPIPELAKCIATCVTRLREGPGGQQLAAADVGAVIAAVKARTGQDFAAYKSGTMSRRIVRRMNLLRFEKVGDYVAHLRTNPDEAGQLLNDLLINVTRFFRDPAVWDRVKSEVIVPLMARGSPDALRLWVPACSTGEEAYTLAMLMTEAADEVGAPATPWQLFATDLDEHAISLARTAHYPAAITEDVSEERLARFFEAGSSGYRVRKSLRERVVFARQNLLTDPPFSRLDVISCRNVMIYLAPATQARLLDLFGFALSDDGALILGASESVATTHRSFRPLDIGSRIYRRVAGGARAPMGLNRGGAFPAAERAVWEPRREPASLADRVRRQLLDRFAPGSAVISVDGVVHYFHGPVRRLLDVPEGQPSRNLFDLLPPVLRPRLRDVVRQAAEVGEGRAHARGVPTPDGPATVEIVVQPLPDNGEERLFLVSLLERPDAGAGSGAVDLDEGTSSALRQLERDLLIAREELQTTVEELETSNEELKASNEEAMAANEELQSSNEELETSREELQSLNEELVTVNTQLEDKVAQVEKATADLRNLLASSQLPVLFLDGELRVRDFTDSLRAVFDLRDGAAGVQVTELRQAVPDPTLVEDCRTVLRDLQPNEVEISEPGGPTFLRRAHPYRTADNRIDGVVLTYADISASARTGRLLARREGQARLIADLGQEGLRAEGEGPFFQRLCEQLRWVVGCDYAQILAWDEGAQAFRVAAEIGWDSAERQASVTGDGLAGFALRHGGAVLVPDLARETRFAATEAEARHGARSAMAVPVVMDGGPWGALCLHSTAAGAFDSEDLNVLRAAANIAAATAGLLRRRHEVEADRTALRLALEGAQMRTWTLAAAGAGSADPDTLASGTGRVAADHRAAVAEALDAALRDGTPLAVEFPVEEAGQGRHWMAARGTLLSHPTERRLIGVSFDVTERRHAEERQRLILRELDHRVKNMLAIVLSIARITGRNATSTETFVEGFADRLAAMARTHTLLANSRWRGVAMADVATEELAQFANGENIAMDGPDLPLSIEAAQALSMALHELATNSAKYGALSRDEGRLRLEWSLEPANGGEVRLRWTETGGPPVAAPTTRGFGSVVLDRILTQQLSARVDADFRPEGLVVEAVMPARIVRALDQVPSPDGPRSVPLPSRRPVAGTFARLRGRRILVVDDEWLIVEESRAWLAGAGAEVSVATSLRDAQRLAETSRPEAAVIDFNLGGQPATDLIVALAGRGIPVLLMTGYSRTGDLDERVEDLPRLTKPVSGPDMLAALAAQFAGADR